VGAAMGERMVWSGGRALICGFFIGEALVVVLVVAACGSNLRRSSSSFLLCIKRILFDFLSSSSFCFFIAASFSFLALSSLALL